MQIQVKTCVKSKWRLREFSTNIHECMKYLPNATVDERELWTNFWEIPSRIQIQNCGSAKLHNKSASLVYFDFINSTFVIVGRKIMKCKARLLEYLAPEILIWKCMKRITSYRSQTISQRTSFRHHEVREYKYNHHLKYWGLLSLHEDYK